MSGRAKLASSVDNMVSSALWATEVKVFLRRCTHDVVDGPDVRIRFATSIEAEQFHKLLMRRRRGRLRR